MPVQLEALQGQTLTGRITEIAASANRESRVFNIEVSLPNRDRSLKVGMIASIRIKRADAQNVPVVPMTALMTAESGSKNYSVFTVKEREGKQFAQLKSVRIGENFGKSVVIDEGLTPGERIIVNRTNQLSAAAVDRDGRMLPGLASVAEQQGAAVTKNIARDIWNLRREPFRYRDWGSMATIGERAAVVQWGRPSMC